MSKNTVVVVFARLPVPGKAKTRLAAGVGTEAAATFYKLCAESIFHEAYRCISAEAVVFCSAADEVTGMQQWLQQNETPMPVQAQQQTADLGQRMVAALTTAIKASTSLQQQQQQDCHQQATSGVAAANEDAESIGLQQQCSAAIVIGTDIPDLSAAVLDKAVDALQQYDMVLGPAKDGGYYLIGFRTNTLLKPEVQSYKVFEGVTWSTDSVLKDTVRAAEAVSVNLAPLDVLPMLQDIDTLEDLQAWLEQQQSLAGMEHQDGQQQQMQGPEGQQLEGQQQQQVVGQQNELQGNRRDRLLRYSQTIGGSLQTA